MRDRWDAVRRHHIEMRKDKLNTAFGLGPSGLRFLFKLLVLTLCVLVVQRVLRLRIRTERARDDLVCPSLIKL
jgi:hypothetical protein